MYDSAGSHAEHAGMAVHTAHGDRGGSAAGGREKSALGRKERLSQRLPSVVRYPDQIRCYVNPPAPLPLYSPRFFPRSRDKRWFQRYCYLTASTKLLLRLQKAAELQTILIVIFWFLFSFPFRTFPKSMLCYPMFRIPSHADVCKVFPEKKGILILFFRTIFWFIFYRIKKIF